MTTNNAYILGVLNSAVYFEDKKVKILYGDSSVISQLDGYVWSQLCAIKPEYREVKFSSIEKLLEETNDESKKHEALELSLELMDTTLSHDYRLGVSKILGELLNSDDKLVSFTLNRLYSTPLPEKFSANQAFELLMPKFSRAGDFYLDLESKTTFFSYFYTLFKLELELEFQKQDLLDQVLTDSGCYAKFTIALYETSKKKYDSVSFEILKHLKEFHIPHSPNIFFEIEHRLRYDYNVLLNGKAIQVSILEKESKPTEESDEILHLIENHYITKQSEHDTKKSKRGKAKRVEPSFGDMRDVVEALKDWAKNYAYRGDEAFLHEFKNVVAKQLKYSKPEQLCKTCCDLASYFTQKNRFNLSKKLLKYAKRLNSEDNVIYSQEAELYNKSGDLQKALALYNLAIQKFGNDAVDYCGKAETFRDMGKFNDALKLYEEAIQRFGDNVVPYCGKAETFRDMGKFNDALKLYEETIQRFGDNVVAYCGKAETFRDMGKLDDALKLYEEAIQRFSDNIFVYNGKAETFRNMGKLDDALKLYEEAIQRFSDNIFAYNGKAETFRDMGKFDDALKLYEETIQRFGDNVVAYCGKAETFRDMGKLDDALKFYEETIQRFGDNVVAYNGKAETFRDMGKFDDALKLYEETIQRFGDNVFAYNGKAETLRNMGKFDATLKLYEETIQRFGDNVVAYNGKAETFRDMGKFEDALKLYEETIQRFGDNVFAYNGKAETFRDMGKLDDALKFYEETIQRFGDNVVAYNGKAETFRGMGRLDEALQQYDDNLQRNSKNRIAETGRLKLLLETNQLEKHLNILVKSKYETFDDYFNLHIYSMFLIKKGDWDKALKLINLGLKSPFFQNKLYFKGLASFLKILQKEYTIALSYFNPNEANKPIENLLATHAFAATNQIGQAKIVLHKLDHIEIPVIKTTLSYLSERYILNGFKKSDKSDDELDALIIEGEMKALLQF